MRLSGRIWVHRPEQKRVSCTTGRDVYTGPRQELVRAIGILARLQSQDMAGDSMLCKSREMAKFQPLQFSTCRVTVGRIQLPHLPTAAHSYLNMDTLNTEAKKTWWPQWQTFGARCLGNQRKGKLETLTLQITETHFPILEQKLLSFSCFFSSFILLPCLKLTRASRNVPKSQNQ